MDRVRSEGVESHATIKLKAGLKWSDGQPFTAEKAQEVGIVTAVVPHAELLERAGKAAAMLA